MTKALAKTGMDAASIAKYVAADAARRPAADAIEIDEADEGRAVSIFLAMDTQWSFTTAGMVQGNGGVPVRTGLQYAVIPTLAAMLGFDIGGDAGRQILIDLRTMEGEAMKTLAEGRR